MRSSQAPVFSREEWQELNRPRQDLGGKSAWETMACPYCGGVHHAKCPRVRKIEFHADGSTPKVVEFYEWGEWPEQTVLWPDQVHVPEEVTQ